MIVGGHQQFVPPAVLQTGDLDTIALADSGSTHTVQFYEQDDALLDHLSEFAGSALGGGHPCLVIATPSHRRELARVLSEQGVNVEHMIDCGRFMLLDAADTLKLFMVDGQVDPERFFSVVGALVSEASIASVDKGRRLAAFGEMVALLWQEGKPEAAIRLEQMWNELGRRYNFSLLCAYPMHCFGREEDALAFQHVCAEHSYVKPCESYGGLSSDAEKHLNVSALQQKAQMLQSELDRRKRAEEALRKSEEFTRGIVESSIDCIKVLDLDGRLVYISPRGQQVLGIADISSVMNQRWVDFWDPEDHERASSAIDAAKAGGVARFEGCLRTAAETTWWDVTLAPMLTDDFRVERLLVISRENTQMKLAQAALMQAEKLAATGRLAATVAHEINNPLEAVTNFIYLAKTSDGVPEEVQSYLEVADQELARVGHIAQQTLGFYRDSANPETFQLEAFMQSVVSLYLRKIQYKNICLDLQTDNVKMFARKGELKQVLSNLLTNAIDATGAGGRIVLRTHHSTNWKSGLRGVRIVVADTGSGMSAATQARAFSAFFTTKADVGTGIGLWVTKNILERSGGSIHCHSTEGPVAGTVMSVFLPLEAR